MYFKVILKLIFLITKGILQLLNYISISKNKKPSCENRSKESTIIIYARTALFENGVNLEEIKILRTWSVFTSPYIYICMYVCMRTDQVLIT
jgi:hypothetical protein